MIAVEEVSREKVTERVAALQQAGYRFVTITCVKVEQGMAELLYHFDLELGLVHLRLRAAAAQSLPSISATYYAAYLVENEIQDQFGLSFAGLQPDYRRTLYLEGPDTTPPFLGTLRQEEES